MTETPSREILFQVLRPTKIKSVNPPTLSARWQQCLGIFLLVTPLLGLRTVMSYSQDSWDHSKQGTCF